MWGGGGNYNFFFGPKCPPSFVWIEIENVKRLKISSETALFSRFGPLGWGLYVTWGFTIVLVLESQLRSKV